MRTIRIDIQEGDEAWMKNYKEQVEMLAGMVIETVEENPKLLLSPIFREMLIDKARLIKSKHRTLALMDLHVDNTGKPLADKERALGGNP